ncbi:MAG: DHH family phosphoesterase [Patescibacteria group bacterium]
MNFIKDLQSAYSKIKEAKKILLIGHVSPDADALASIGAMAEFALDFGIEVYAYASGRVEGAYQFIPHNEIVSSIEPDDLRKFDVVLILDCGSISRTGLEPRIRELLRAEKEGRISHRPEIIEFDHHQPSEKYADLEIRYADKASTTEIIYNFLKVNGREINKIMAHCILIGLMTDTGHFLHANSSREAIAIASEMLLRGASLPKIVNSTVHNKSFSSLKIWGRALDNLELDERTGLAVSALTAGELEELSFSEALNTDTDLFGDLVSFFSTLSGVRVALFLREENGRVKGSLRTNHDDVDVSQIASFWGGGGHKKAAGFSIEGRLEKTAFGWQVIK